MEPREYNELCIKQLNEFKLTDYVAVIGSGPSTPFLPSIQKLKELFQSDDNEEKNTDLNLWEIAENAFLKDHVAYHKIIEESYGKSTYQFSQAYQYILDLPFAGFVTFNYDEQIPELCSLQKTGEFSIYPPPLIDVIENGVLFKKEARYAGPEDFISNRIPKPILAIHGCYQENNPDWSREIILKRTDYEKHYTNKDSHILHDWWKTLLSLKSCIFIGTSLKEPGLRSVIRCIQEDRNSMISELPHIHLMDAKRLNSETEYKNPDYTHDYIKQLYYDPIDNDFTGLVEIFRSLSKLHKNKLLTPRVGPRTEVYGEKY